METKFTKGEWQYSPTYEGFEVAQKTIQHPIATRTAVIPYGDEEGEANAKLIAAAPELLEALLQITSAVVHEKFNKSDEIKMAMSAIKKATE